MIDTHAHLYLKDFEDDQDQLIEKALEVGVKKVLLPNINRSTVEALHNLCDYNTSFYFPMMGVHPCYIKEDYLEELAAARKLLENQKYYGVGEIGIDLYWDKTFEDEQKEAFRTQLEWAKEMQLPVSIHSRNALKHTIAIAEELQDGNLTGVFHCFNGSKKQAKRIMNLGMKMGIGGVITYGISGMEVVMSFIESDAYVLETDAPYLGPQPHKGKRNEPSYLPLIANKIAECRNETLEKVIEDSSKTATLVFFKEQ